MRVANEFWIGPYEPYNWPVWAEYDTDNEIGYDCGPSVAVGVLMARHGDCVIHVAPATPEQYAQVRRLLLEVWARRADAGFVRYGGERRLGSDDRARERRDDSDAPPSE